MILILCRRALPAVDYSWKVRQPAPLPQPQVSMDTVPAVHLQLSLCVQLQALQAMSVLGLAWVWQALLEALPPGR